MANAPPGSVPAFSPLLSEAAKDSRRLLDFLLDQVGLSYDEWICLNAVAVSGQPVEAEVVCRAVAERLGWPVGQVHEAARHLEAKKLLQADNSHGREVLSATEAGAARWDALTSQINATSEELLSALDPADLAASLRVLQAVTSKAPAILARWQPTSER
jgi:DNA-binding MarR family transcriptional regulator